MTDNDLKTKAATTNESLARWFSVFALSGALSLGGFAGSVASAQSAEEHQTYNKPIVIRPGDTLSHIALRELGSEKRAQELAEANGLKLEQILKPGDSINIPVTLPVRDEFATLIFSKVRVTINGEVAKPNEQVRRNDILETDRSGYASLEFSTGSVINLQPNTLARIVTLHCQPNDDTCIIEMAAERGTLSADVQSEDGRSTDFRVQTPYASAAVRGTSFDVDSNSTGLRVGVTDGAVALGAANSDQVVELDAGFGSVAAPGTPLSGPIALLPAPVFRFVPPRITQNDLVRWFTLTDVNQYIVQIAEQPSGVGVIAETSVNSDIFRLNEDIPAGDYHLLLRPVDENGLLGFTATSPVTIANTDPNIDAATVSVERENGTYRIEIVQEVAEATGYEVQISTNASFTDPVSVDVNETGTAVVRLTGDNLFARARALVDRTSVGPYGQATTVNER